MLTAGPSSTSRSTALERFAIPFSWAAYLGCSWTWCIGMFLPVILVAQYGLGGWIVFAVPNVIGAAAMGWVLARPGASERILTEHRTACVAFSAVTLAFHAFFLIWLSHFAGTPIIPPEWAFAAVVAGTIVGLIGRRFAVVDLSLAWIVLGVSIAVMVKGFGGFTIAKRGIREGEALTALLSLAPVCAFGFLLCPYLDVTFHRAKRATTSTGGKIAFGVGFGVFFLAMIFLTLMYAGDLAFDSKWTDHFGSFGAVGLVTWVAAHMAVQTGFTWAAHLRAVPRLRTIDVVIWLSAAAMVAASWIFLSKKQWFDELHQMTLTGEAIYRIFMAFYGLVFPAYVWICMVPIRGASPGPTPRALVVSAIAILVAAPMFWMGFIAGQMLWLAPGLAVVLSARLLAGAADHLSPSPGTPGEGWGGGDLRIAGGVRDSKSPSP
jgi:hypothetical protein